MLFLAERDGFLDNSLHELLTGSTWLLMFVRDG